MNRDDSKSNGTIKALNDHLKYLVERYNTQLEFLDTQQNYMFSDNRGHRRTRYFLDMVHLNNVGTVKLARHLKFITHNGLPC